MFKEHKIKDPEIIELIDLLDDTGDSIAKLRWKHENLRRIILNRLEEMYSTFEYSDISSKGLFLDISGRTVTCIDKWELERRMTPPFHYKECDL